MNTNSVFDNTALNATIDEKWDTTVQEGRYAQGVVMPRVYNKSDLVANSGDIIHMQYEDAYETVSVTQATGAFLPVTNNITGVTLTLNQWEAVPVEVVDYSKFQSLYDPSSDIPKKIAKAFAVKYDTMLLNLYTNFTTLTPWKSGTNPTVFDETVISYAMLKVSDIDEDLTDFSWVLPPVAYYNGIAIKPEFTDASKMGLPKSTLTTGFRFPLMGVPAYQSTRCPTDNLARVGMLFKKTAMAIAMNKKTEFRRADNVSARRLSKTVVGHTVFGVKEFRTDQAVVVYISKQ